MNYSSEEQYCLSTICSSDSPFCNWSKWDNPLDNQFPDGSLQTCVGAQVRCGCTTTLYLISYVTYEHPTAVTVLSLFLCTLTLITLIKCLVTQQDFSLFCCICFPVDTKPPGFYADTVNPGPVNQDESSNGITTTISLGGNSSSINPDGNVQIYFIEVDKPPSYTYVMMQEKDKFPPSYFECVKDHCNKTEK